MWGLTLVSLAALSGAAAAQPGASLAADARAPADAADAVDATIPPTPAWHLTPDSVWINAGDFSEHFNQSEGFRQDNWGIGGQLNYGSELAFLGGTFLNSNNRRSHDAGVLWQPWALGPVKLGAVAGAFDGYPYMHNGAWFPALLPMASASVGRLGANLTVLPNYKNRLHGALVVQFIFRVW